MSKFIELTCKDEGKYLINPDTGLRLIIDGKWSYWRTLDSKVIHNRESYAEVKAMLMAESNQAPAPAPQRDVEYLSDKAHEVIEALNDFGRSVSNDDYGLPLDVHNHLKMVRLISEILK